MEHDDLEVALTLDKLSVADNEMSSSKSASGDIAPGEIIIGTLEGLDEQGNALVDFAENLRDKPLAALSTVAITQRHSGQQVALLFAEGNLEKPVVMGLIHNPLNQLIESFEMLTEQSPAQPAPEEDTLSAQQSDQIITTDAKTTVRVPGLEDAYVDGKRVVIEGREEIVLKCGEASITLTKAGKILIRGKYLLNRSTGVNRIMGGSVQVN